MNLEALPRTIECVQDKDGLEIVMVDQRRLPQELSFMRVRTWRAMREAIKDMTVRGAPALGLAGAAALALFIANEASKNKEEALAALEQVAKRVANARPTAVNLPRATMQMRNYIQSLLQEEKDRAELTEALFLRLKKLEAEDEAANRAIGAHASSLLDSGSRLLTHCNAGSLATVFYGTALAAVYTAAAEGKIEKVYVDETRPVDQGARLTAWELSRVGVPATLICDNMAASLMAQGLIDAVFIGADRICKNGDVANKIGSYGLAVLARYHRLPLYVCAPSTTFDFQLSQGEDVLIEQRSSAEVTPFKLPGVGVLNPAFDITPASLIDSIITERGIFKPQELAQVYRVE